MEGGEWCQASHGFGFHMFHRDVVFFNAKFHHACAETRSVEAGHRYCLGSFMKANLVKQCKNKRDAAKRDAA